MTPPGPASASISKLRIGLLIYGRLGQRSGGYLYDRTLVDILRSRGHKVQVISLPWRNYLSHLGDNFSASLLQKLSRLQLDILLQDELNHPSLFLLNAKLRKRVSYPIISIVHHLRSSEDHPALLRALYRIVERRYLRSVDGFVFNSFTTRRVVNGLLDNKKRHVVAQPAGDRLRPRMTFAQLRTRASASGPLRVIFVGSLIQRKAPHLLLAALRRLPPGSVEVTFAGAADPDPSYARSLQSAAHDSTGVMFAGHMGEAQLAAAMRRSHVLVLPSSYEGYGIAYLEGMGFGLPAIGTRAGAAGELITHGENGFLISPGNDSALAVQLLRLHRDRRLLLRMGKAARQRYDKHPTWQQSMARIEQFLFRIYNQTNY